LFVSLELVEGRPDRSILVSGILEFDHSERQAVYKDHDVGSAIILPLDHRKLVDHEPVVVLGILEVNHPNCDTMPAVRPDNVNRNAVHKIVVDSMIVFD